ncbi:MAG TPA: FadR/GntR family transcriptional regulator [Solirubrobacteraceae bacterium]|nr:FadR/GntR family transcriptional regulator [Solirubrobacteraceae bacterium]
MIEANGIVPVRRVRKASEQVADQLRELILSGQIAPEQRLPNETVLAAQFGVSRSTIREALRELSALSLIRTMKGVNGGSFVTVPTVEHISAFLSANIGLLSQAEHVSLDEVLEARVLLEVPAVRLAARRRTETDLDNLRAAIPERPLDVDQEHRFNLNKDFHSVLVAASGNTLLSICAQPIFTVLQTSLKRSTLGNRFHYRVAEDHRALMSSIESGDEAAAAEQMHDHLNYLTSTYRKAWRHPVAAEHGAAAE